MPINPVFARKGAGTELPIKVSGTGGSPKIGLDLGHHGFRNDKSR